MRHALLLALAVSLATPRLLADDAPTPTQTEEAKRFFEQGEALRSAGQYQAALEAYLKSRALVPRASNTVNAGVCLYALKRYDEAYEYFEEALTKYPSTQLPADARESAKKTMGDIEAKVGRLDVSANTDGSLLVDGRPRGKVPLTAPIRVMPGKHVVRVLRDGFETFEKVVDVKVGETASVDAVLKPLTSAGRLRVEGGSELEGGSLTVDGAVVGTLPWEGTLQPGLHVLQVVKGDVGTGPTVANVIVGQTIATKLSAKPLGPERRFVVDPPTADLAIDGVQVGKGRFQGRLPVGAHVVEAREVGYLPQKVTVSIDAESSADVSVKLVVDANHPRWGVATKSRFALELVGGFALAPSTGNDGAGWCLLAKVSCAQTSAAKGPRVGLQGVYELPSRLHVFFGAGWLQLARQMQRVFPVTAAATGTLPALDTQWTQTDAISIRGPFATVGVGYRVSLGETLDVGFRLGISGAFVRVSDDTSGSSATGGGRTLATNTDNSGVAASGLMFTADPSVDLGLWASKHVRLALGVKAPISLLDGPTMKLGDTRIADPNKDCTKSALDCAKAQRFDANTAAYGRFVSIVPEVSVGYVF